MRRTLLPLLLIALLAPAVQAAPVANDIAVLCQKTHPGLRAVQSFCIKQHRNYHDWLQYERKRIFNNKKSLAHLDSCVAKNYPDYRQAFDCATAKPTLFGLF
ncbi:hypothetical protein [Motiliproteus sediminis]|uniref:hypothetical protein n=1 Tax=Motiliproteus sediminis TaxID=1468178 RepID=UPI001AEFD866|nr:hypothetical protein [Motiliproteus sediminis]